MVDPRVDPSKADVELADVVRQFGPQYISQWLIRDSRRLSPDQSLWEYNSSS